MILDRVLYGMVGGLVFVGLGLVLCGLALFAACLAGWIDRRPPRFDPSGNPLDGETARAHSRTVSQSLLHSDRETDSTGSTS